MSIQFTRTFNIETSGRRDYAELIDGVRDKLRQYGGESHGHPVLPPRQERPTQWFEMVLQTKRHEIRLLFRLDSLHLDAYQVDDSDEWSEFTSEYQREHLVPGSSLLPFDGSYGSYNGLETVAGTRRFCVPLDQDGLTRSINTLATSSSLEKIAHSLLVVIQMTAESIRFEDLTYFILDVYYSRLGCNPRPHPTFEQLQNSWGHISNAICRFDAYPHLSIFPIRYYVSDEVEANIGDYMISLTAEQAQDSISVILSNFKGNINLPNGALGRRLAEIFWVKINSIKGEDSGEIYGTIKVNDGLVSQYIYHLNSWDKQPVTTYNKYVFPTNHACQVISALDNFTIDVDLKEYVSCDYVSKGQVAWNVYDPTNVSGDCDDMPKHVEIKGSSGSSATVVYAVFSNAVQATVEVVMINVGPQYPALVYGTIAALNTHENFKDDYMSILFHISEDSGKSETLRTGEHVPLFKSVVAVPFNTSLKVFVDLYDRQMAPDRYSNIVYPITEGIANFPAQLSGTVEEDVHGIGKVRVKVTWAP